MKIKLELNMPSDEDTFLNFWNWYNGNDLVCEIRDGKLFEITYNDEEKIEKEISLQDWLNKMKEKLSEIPM